RTWQGRSRPGNRGRGVTARGDEGPDWPHIRGKPPVHGAHADARAFRDVVQGGLEPPLGEHLGGSPEYALAVALGIRTQRARARLIQGRPLSRPRPAAHRTRPPPPPRSGPRAASPRPRPRPRAPRVELGRTPQRPPA